MAKATISGKGTVVVSSPAALAELTVVQTASGFSASDNGTVVFQNAVTPGNTLIVIVFTNVTTLIPNAVLSGLMASYVNDVVQVWSTGLNTCNYSGPITTAGKTLTIAAGTKFGAFAMEVLGTVVFDQVKYELPGGQNGVSGPSTAPTTPNITPSKAPSIIFAAAQIGAEAFNAYPASPWVTPFENINSGFNAVSYQTVNSEAQVSAPVWGQPSSDHYIAYICQYSAT